MAAILAIDDDPRMRALLADVLGAEGFDVVLAADADAALAKVRAERFPVVLLDLRMPGMDGMALLPELRRIDPHASVIILTASNDVTTAVQAIKLGAYDYLTKPCDTGALVLVIRRALERGELLAHVAELRSRIGKASGLAERMGSSATIGALIQQVEQVAESNLTVLVEGETGSGKELVARAIHQASARRDHAFVAIDCGAIPDTLIESELFGYERGAFSGADRRKDGHFQLAEGGTLFLDEIVNLPLATQTRLLRVLQERQVQPLGARVPVYVDVRIVAASNANLEEEMRAGRFRADLYYRLNEFRIVVPPLRDRRDDIAYLAQRFADEAAMELRHPVRGISDRAMELLRQHDWPGNARELRNVIRQAVVRGRDVVLPEHLALGPAVASAIASGTEENGTTPPTALSLKEAAQLAAADAERRTIRQALEASGGNKSEAARALRTDYKTLHVKMKQYGISARDFTRPA